MVQKVSGPLPAPDAKWHRRDAEYVRALFERIGMSKRELSELIGVTDRVLRLYASGDQAVPYTVQYALEALANSRGETMNAVRDTGAAYGDETKWFEPSERPITKSDVRKLLVGKDQYGAHIMGPLHADGFGNIVVHQVDANSIEFREVPVDRVSIYTLLDQPSIWPRGCPRSHCPACYRRETGNEKLQTLFDLTDQDARGCPKCKSKFPNELP